MREALKFWLEKPQIQGVIIGVILFNAAIGLVFWRKAQRDLFGK